MRESQRPLPLGPAPDPREAERARIRRAVRETRAQRVSAGKVYTNLYLEPDQVELLKHIKYHIGFSGQSEALQHILRLALAREDIREELGLVSG